MGSGERAVVMMCCGVLLVPSILMLACSWSTLSTNQIALDYNGISKSVSSKVWDIPGVHFLGLGHHFIKFDATLQTMTFSSGDHDLLHLRTSDGLPLVLGVSLQWHYERTGIHYLYQAFGEEITTGVGPQVLFNGASHVIFSVACNYSSSQFFNDKQGIALQMHDALDSYFKEHYGCSVDSLQINFMELPSEFQNAILRSITVKQNITTIQKYKENMEVTFQTNLMASKQNAQAIELKALGEASQLTAEAEAKAKIVNQTVQAELQSYKAMQKGVLNSDGDTLMQYVWWDSLSEGTSAQMLVGVNSNLYVPTSPLTH